MEASQRFLQREFGSRNTLSEVEATSIRTCCENTTPPRTWRKLSSWGASALSGPKVTRRPERRPPDAVRLLVTDATSSSALPAWAVHTTLQCTTMNHTFGSPILHNRIRQTLTLAFWHRWRITKRGTTRVMLPPPTSSGHSSDWWAGSRCCDSPPSGAPWARCRCRRCRRRARGECRRRQRCGRSANWKEGKAPLSQRWTPPPRCAAPTASAACPASPAAAAAWPAAPVGHTLGRVATAETPACSGRLLAESSRHDAGADSNSAGSQQLLLTPFGAHNPCDQRWSVIRGSNAADPGLQLGQVRVHRHGRAVVAIRSLPRPFYTWPQHCCHRCYGGSELQPGEVEARRHGRAVVAVGSPQRWHHHQGCTLEAQIRSSDLQAGEVGARRHGRAVFAAGSPPGAGLGCGLGDGAQVRLRLRTHRPHLLPQLPHLLDLRQRRARGQNYI